MLRRCLVISAFLLLLGGPLAGATGNPVEGFLEAEAASLSGDIETSVPDPILWLDAPESVQTQPITIEAASASITYKELRIETAHVDTPIDSYTVALPQQVETEETTYDDVTITLSKLGPNAQFFLEPGADGLVADVHTTEATSNLGALPSGLHVVDGYTAMFEDNEPDTHPDFYYETKIDRGLAWISEASNVTVQGSAHSYIWDTTVHISNETAADRTYDTGMEERSSYEGSKKDVLFSYVVLDLEGAKATWATPSEDLKLLGPGMSLALDGSLRLDKPHGTLQAPEGLYRSEGQPTALLEGRLDIQATPGASQDQGPSLTLGIEGPVEETDLPLVTDDQGLTTLSVAAGAGGITVLGMALWYLASGKIAALSLVGALRQPKQEPPSTKVEIKDPKELLHDPDRFTLYHLIRSRTGLSAEECANLTGIQEAHEHLDVLATNGLLSTIAEDPRRYMLPGHASPEDQERINLLREPGAKRLADLIDMHGMTPEATVLDRAEAIESPVPRDRAAVLLDRFEERGLVYRETGEIGPVVDPTETLRSCLKRMGDGDIP